MIMTKFEQKDNKCVNILAPDGVYWVDVLSPTVNWILGDRFEPVQFHRQPPSSRGNLSQCQQLEPIYCITECDTLMSQTVHGNNSPP